ncbi:MAG TPA: hypothetical protein VI197_22205 [Polyangiaceae bacterium]
MNRWLWMTLAAALALAACKKQETEQTPEAQTPDTQPAKAAELSEAAIEQADVPVKEDFEEEAQKAIDEDNLESQIDALEKEIAGDKE